MTPFPARLGLALFWLASLGGAYWAGKGFPPPIRENLVEEAPATAITLLDNRGSSETNVAPEEAATSQSIAQEDAVSIVAKARQDLGKGPESMNPAAVFRAFSPLMELPASKMRSVLAEVVATVEDPQQQAMFESILLAKWAEEEPLAALAYAEKRAEDGNPASTQSIMSVVGTWAREDPEAAWSWYQKRQADAPLVAERLDLLDNDQARHSAIGGIAMASMEPEARDAILARTATLESEIQQELRQAVMNQWAQNDPSAAMAWLRDLPPSEREPLLDNLAYTLVAVDPEKGAAMLLEGAEEKSLSNRYRMIVDVWSNRDPIAAGEWLNRQPKGPALDAARGSFARRVLRGDPEAAMAWAKSIESENQRRQSIEGVYEQWHRRDAAAADEALSQSGLSAEKIEEIRKKGK